MQKNPYFKILVPSYQIQDTRRYKSRDIHRYQIKNPFKIHVGIISPSKILVGIKPERYSRYA